MMGCFFWRSGTPTAAGNRGSYDQKLREIATRLPCLHPIILFLLVSSDPQQKTHGKGERERESTSFKTQHECREKSREIAPNQLNDRPADQLTPTHQLPVILRGIREMVRGTRLDAIFVRLQVSSRNAKLTLKISHVDRPGVSLSSSSSLSAWPTLYKLGSGFRWARRSAGRFLPPV